MLHSHGIHLKEIVTGLWLTEPSPRSPPKVPQMHQMTRNHTLSNWSNSTSTFAFSLNEILITISMWQIFLHILIIKLNWLYLYRYYSILPKGIRPYILYLYGIIGTREVQEIFSRCLEFIMKNRTV